MSVTLFEALDYHWNHTNDWAYQAQHLRLPLRERIRTLLTDCLVFIFASILRVQDPRTSSKAIREYKEYVSRNSHQSLDESSVILILNGADDLPVSPEIYKRLSEQSGCKIQFRKITFLHEIDEELDSLKRRGNGIKALWIRAHGSPFAITFNPLSEISCAPPLSLYDSYRRGKCEETQAALRTQLAKLDHEAPIILESCFTGQSMEDGNENVAHFIARAAGKRRVYAPSRESLPIENGILYVPGQGFTVSIKSFQPATAFDKRALVGRIGAVWHAFRNHQVDITREFCVET